MLFAYPGGSLSAKQINPFTHSFATTRTRIRTTTDFIRLDLSNYLVSVVYLHLSREIVRLKGCNKVM